MLLTYASHRLRSFFNSTSSLECAGHMQFLKLNSTSRIFSDPGSTFPTPRRAAPSQNNQITFERKAVYAYDVLRSTLCKRLKGSKQRYIANRIKQKLTEREKHTCIIYSPSLGWEIAVFDQEREQSRFGRSSEEARGREQAECFQ